MQLTTVTVKRDIEISIGEIPEFITISVVDFGQGIGKTEIKMIFNKYYSVAKKIKKSRDRFGFISFTANCTGSWR